MPSDNEEHYSSLREHGEERINNGGVTISILFFLPPKNILIAFAAVSLPFTTLDGEKTKGSFLNRLSYQAGRVNFFFLEMFLSVH